MTDEREAMVALAPCPFCGGQAKIIEGEESAYVQCLDVKMHRALWFDGDNNAANEVAEQWNKRAFAAPGYAVKALETVAAFLLARDEEYAVTPNMLQWAKTLIDHGRNAEHSGDCTKESHACGRCIADKALADAAAIIALLEQPATPGFTLNTPMTNFSAKREIEPISNARLQEMEAVVREVATPGYAAGFVLMPREATREMTLAACDCLPACEHIFGHAGELLRNSYRRMVEVSALPAPAPPVASEVTVPRVSDNDRDEITVTLNGKELRGWSYSTDAERRTKMLCAREFVEGFCTGRQP